MHRVDIRESYRDWTPPVNVVKPVRRLLESVPEKFTAGLGAIVLTNASGLNHSERKRKTRSRGRKVRIAEASGLYHQAWQGRPAWIELFIDNVFRAAPRLALVLMPIREMLLGTVLFHELGHHIHQTQAPEFREKEEVAERWQQRLLLPYLQERYWYLLRPLLPPLRLVRRVWARCRPPKRLPPTGVRPGSRAGTS